MAIAAGGRGRRAAAQRLATAVAIAATWAGAAVAQSHFGALVQEIVDRDRLAVHPAGQYTLEQASSYDRRATPLGAPSSFANADTANFLRSRYYAGQREYVMLEDSGPGVLTRWWMTGSGATDGEIRVYVDGAATPALSGTMQDLISGSDVQFGSELSFQSRPGVDSGHNLYAPIPYSQSVLVVYRGTVRDFPGWNPPVYYNINYRKYAAAGSVASYTPADPPAHSQAVAATNQALANPGVWGDVTGTYAVSGQALGAGQSLVHQLTGGGAIRRLAVKVDGPDQADALRNTYVELVFDGQRTVQVPVGQFFGNGASGGSQAINPFTDFYRRASADGALTAYWTMPYQNGAEVRLVNRGAASVLVDLEVDRGQWQWDANSMHFHADYRSEAQIATRGGDGTTDWTTLNVRGRGVYVGDTLSVRNRAAAWWGEGDEKVYVDYLDASGAGSGVRPDHIGTGSEDYYGYAWSHPETFSRPFIAQPIGAGNLDAGVSVNSRVRSLDAIPFNEALKFDMELWHWASTSVDVGGATYWYGVPGARSLEVAADLGADYRRALDLAAERIPDASGDGHWQYLSSSHANLSSPQAQTAPLVYGAVGDAGHAGYGGGQNGHNLAAISDDLLFVDGGLNGTVQGKPGYHELAFHPAGDVSGGGFAGQAALPYVAARWTAGPSSAGVANIAGSIRNFITAGDSVDFHIFVDGVERFSASGAGGVLPESAFDFDATLAAGSVVDFVLGNGPARDLFGDESWLRAMIFTDHEPFLPVEGDLDGDNRLSVADWTRFREHFGGDFASLSARAAHGLGDLNGDLRSDVDDFALFKEAYIAAHGAAAFVRLLSVPEPGAASVWLVGGGLGALVRWSRGRCGKPPGQRRVARIHSCGGTSTIG
ncbi:MAG: hypothetical protein DCC67_20005 [Planctomycetota bacterium]|nr:MAG: hypothetical protein DCC67_20005 [Planctomycetota bacterium]